MLEVTLLAYVSRVNRQSIKRCPMCVPYSREMNGINMSSVALPRRLGALP